MQQISAIGFNITQQGISPPPLHWQQPIWYGRQTLWKPLPSNSILCLFVDGWISNTPTPISMAPSTLPQLTDAKPATVSPNMTGIFLFDIHKIFRTHLLGSTIHPTPFTLILVFKFHSATLHTLPLYMCVKYGLRLLYPLTKGLGYPPFFPRNSQKGSGRLCWCPAIASNSARWNCDAVSIDQSSIIHECQCPCDLISSSTIDWDHKEKCLAFSLALSCGSSFC